VCRRLRISCDEFFAPYRTTAHCNGRRSTACSFTRFTRSVTPTSPHMLIGQPRAGAEARAQHQRFHGSTPLHHRNNFRVASRRAFGNAGCKNEARAANTPASRNARPRFPGARAHEGCRRTIAGLKFARDAGRNAWVFELSDSPFIALLPLLVSDLRKRS